MKRKSLVLVMIAGLMMLSCNKKNDDDITIPNQENQETNLINGHEYVDLGLSVKWATCNIGASSPEDYGNYYAWGETNTKNEYNPDNSLTYNVPVSDFSGNSYYDVAKKEWGSTWRIPSSEEISELINKCLWEWTSKNGVTGCEVKGPSGKTIFIPAAGLHVFSSLSSEGVNGYYWSSSPYEDDNKEASYLYFEKSDWYGDGQTRYFGLSIRPVTE